MTDPSDATGMHDDETGDPMQRSKQIQDPAFLHRCSAESRALLATIRA